MAGNSLRTLAAWAGTAAVIGAAVVACGAESKNEPSDTVTPSTPGSSATPSASPTEKSLSTSGPNSFSPQIKAPTPYSPRPADCLPDWC